MSILLNNTQGATKISSPARIVTVYDNLSGCPPTRTSPLLTASITVYNPSYFRMTGTFIRNYSGRTDLQVYLVGPAGSNYASSTLLTRRLNWTSGGTWDNVVLDTGAYGNLSGTYTFSITADSPSSWGCGRYHGRISVLALEVV